MISVTTFSQKGYNIYGKRFLETYAKHWPFKIVVYCEALPDFQHEKIEYRDFFEIPNVVTFYEYFKNLPIAHGMVGAMYDYNYDLWKFSRKVFAQFDLLRDYRGKAFWLDADIETVKDVTEDFLSGLFDDKTLCYMGRKSFYTETSFIGFDTERPDFMDFLDWYIVCLRKGIVLSLPRWHDCEIFDWAREKSQVSGNNLSPFYRPGFIDVFPYTVLGEYMKHHKGSRKFKTEVINETRQ